MSHTHVTQSRFDLVMGALAQEDGVERRRSGRTYEPLSTLVDGKAFDRVSPRRTFVVRLPKERIQALVTSGAGRRFEGYRRRRTQEWIVVR